MQTSIEAIVMLYTSYYNPQVYDEVQRLIDFLHNHDTSDTSESSRVAGMKLEHEWLEREYPWLATVNWDEMEPHQRLQFLEELAKEHGDMLDVKPIPAKAFLWEHRDDPLFIIGGIVDPDWPDKFE